MELRGIIFTDGNAASEKTIFYEDAADLDALDWDCLEAEYWTDFDDGARKRCAEALVPVRIPSTRWLESWFTIHRRRMRRESQRPMRISGFVLTGSSDMLKVVKGNIFASECQTLVNTVNCVGVMGAGIALEFKFRYPQMFEQYVEHCRQGQMEIGKLWLCKKPTIHKGKRWILNFPTKKHWKHPSKKEYLHKGLQNFVDTYERRQIQSIAFPILGAQNGGIPEAESIGIMASYLYRCNIEIEIYRYDPTAEDDLYPKFKRKFKTETDDEIASRTGLRRDRIAAIRKALDSPDTTTVGQLASQRGIGAKTLQKVHACLAPPRQGELDIAD